MNTSNIHMFNEDSMKLYEKWEKPVVIISDGPYGVSGYDGDLPTTDGLGEWYEPHIRKWYECATAETTLWFWNTELGWAKVHPFLEKNGWKYVCCNFWDKGLSHVAGNVNTKTIRHLPVTSEVCVQYVYEPKFTSRLSGSVVPMKTWLRDEWKLTGLPFRLANEACGVKDAATRKYLTQCHLWYMPPPDMFKRMADYANLKGDLSNKPYFSVDGISQITEDDWSRMRSKFKCPFGKTNVWTTNQLRSKERVKNGNKAVHFNQKPLELIDMIIEMSSDASDVVWDCFGGLFTTAVSCLKTNRICYTSEINKDMYEKGKERVESFGHDVQQRFPRF